MKRLFSLTFLCYMFLSAGHVLALDTIRIAYSSVNPHALLVSMAEKRGLYAKYGLSSTIVYVSGGSTAIQAMVSGDIDLGQLTGAPGVIANLRGADIVYIAMSDDRMGYQLVTRREVKNAADLKGKRIGISRFGSSSEFGARVLLKRAGVDPKDVSILRIGIQRALWFRGKEVQLEHRCRCGRVGHPLFQHWNLRQREIPAKKRSQNY